MPWSTQQLARIAGTTVNSVRHYHQIGLLPEPDRAPNGYKQYEVGHLVQLLRIRRLADLGIGLGQIASLEDDTADPLVEVRKIDERLKQTIEQLTRSREELALILAHDGHVEVPGGFAELTADLSDRQRSLLAIYATVLDGATFEAFRQVLLRRDPTDLELDGLPPDAQEAEIEDLAQRLASVTRHVNAEFPELADPLARAPLGRASAGAILAQALSDLYNPAQLRVLQRLGIVMEHHLGAGTGDLAVGGWKP